MADSMETEARSRKTAGHRLVQATQRFFRNEGALWHWRPRFPSRVRSSKEVLAVRAKRDAEENAESTPDVGDGAEMIAVWGVEYYTPTQYPALKSAFKRNGWEESRFNRQSPTDWVEAIRLRAGAKGSYNIGVIRRSGDVRRPTDYSAQLPDFCEYATGQIFQVTSSLSALVVGFVLKAEHRREMEDVLRRTYTTVRRPNRHGYSIFSPRLLKRHGVQDVRRRIRGEIANWFVDHAPGIFTNTPAAVEAPTVEVLVLDRSEPFGGFSSGRRNALLDHLEIEQNYDVWRSKDVAGLKFSWNFRDGNSGRLSHGAVAMCRRDIAAIDLKMWGGQSPESLFAYLHSLLDGFIAGWALLFLLDHYEGVVSEIRDSNPQLHHARKPQNLLYQLRRLADASTDVGIVIPDVVADVDEERGFRDLPEFESTRFNGDAISLRQALRDNIIRRAKGLLALNRAMREFVSHQAALVSAHESVRIQHLATWITVGALAIAAASIPDWLRDLIKGGAAAATTLFGHFQP